EQPQSLAPDLRLLQAQVFQGGEGSQVFEVLGPDRAVDQIEPLEALQPGQGPQPLAIDLERADRQLLQPPRPGQAAGARVGDLARVNGQWPQSRQAAQVLHLRGRHRARGELDPRQVGPALQRPQTFIRVLKTVQVQQAKPDQTAEVRQRGCLC